MESTRVIRASGAAGMLAAALILGGLYLLALGTSGRPGPDAGADALAAWAKREEGAIEIGAYVLLVPGLLLFLCTFAALAGLLPADAMWTRLAGYGALAFFILFAAAGVLSSTTASTFGFYTEFEDPTGVTVFTGLTAGYHLQAVGIWSLALTMLATAVGLRYSAARSLRLVVASIILAALAVAGTLVGVGVIPCLVWILAVGIGLLRWTPLTSLPAIARPSARSSESATGIEPLAD
jgi:hypothetical protein